MSLLDKIRNLFAKKAPEPPAPEEAAGTAKPARLKKVCKNCGKTFSYDPDWKFVPNARLAFNAKPDKSDLPNLDLSPAIQVSEVIIHPDRSAEVALKTPLRKAYPTGTSVRMHLSGNSYIYAGYGKKADTWMTFTRTYTGFYRGCRKIKPAVSAASSKCPVEFRNVKVVME